jgi:DNA mismatch repair protein MutS2
VIYPDKFEEKLNFARIREMLAGHCLSPLGQEWVGKMGFSLSFDKVRTLLEQTNEMLHIEDDGGELPVSYYIDVREPLRKIRVEGLFLDEEELFDLRRSLGTIRDLIRFIKSRDESKFPRLHALAANVMVYPAIIDRIDTILNKQGKIKDNASPELLRVRKDIIAIQQNVSRRMAAILKKAKSEGLVEAEVSVSIRDGRAVIPVLSANKRRLPGIIHDESTTGKTTYIEPAEIVEMNNEIRELEYAERRELIRILTEISGFLRNYLEELLYSYEFLGIIDFIRAKAKFAERIEAIVPELYDEPSCRWLEARHPLLYLHHKVQGREIVPLTIEFAPEQRIVIISGPNAGGKSVCLQTVGLVQYMLQCGLPVPVKEGSRMGFFHNIFLDLGDEQSIENDLSTYSSHLTNMKFFVRNADGRSLILIDEFGTGTEPMIGGAIAESVLEQLNRQGVFGVVTTHYTNLKHFASQTDGLVNGAMQFDTDKLQPLFKLEVGSPGSSFAFEIARKIGLPEPILESAKNRLGEDHINFDKHLREIIRDKRYWERKRRQIHEQERRMTDVSERYETELQKLKSERKELLEKARQEAAALLANANKEIENTIKAIRESQAEKEKTKQARLVIENFRERLVKNELVDNTEQERLERKIEAIKNRKPRKKDEVKQQGSPAKAQVAEDTSSVIGEGDIVRLEGQPVPGEVMEIRGENAMVAFGSLVSNVKLSRLTKISRREYKREVRKESSISSSLAERMREKKLSFKPDIDIRGMRGEEAITRISAHMDEALMCGAGQVRILHGKGTGTLRQMVREYLNTMPFVSRYEDEHVQFGGAGFTVVYLD